MTRLNGWTLAAAVFLLCAATTMAASAQSLNTVVSFNGANGAGPFQMTMVQGADGGLYGMTEQGGVADLGTVFALSPDGALTTLYSFCEPQDCTGLFPLGGLVLATNGDFYGTTEQGGHSEQGTIFRMTPGGTLIVIHNFCAQADCSDGASPFPGLIQASDGNLYGSTAHGGYENNGTIFRITPQGAFSTLHLFTGSPDDGAWPYGVMVQASDGRLCGTTGIGGTDNDGTVFKMTLGGALEIIHSFTSADGAGPRAGVVQGRDGFLYGTTFSGGTNGGGTIFRIAPSAKFTTLHSFCTQPNCADGDGPMAELLQATDGNLYGTALGGGVNGYGVIFRISPADDSFLTLYSFCTQDYCPDGSSPYGGLFQATNGNLYGTTFDGGIYQNGTIFSLSMDLAPFVSFVHASGKVGQTGGILGQGFTGTTGVSLNGVPANFKVISDTFIEAAVPAGATTGYVTVTTPSGTLTSNVPFHVIR